MWSNAVLFGKWTDHVKSWRHTELGDRIMYITYEEMVQVIDIFQVNAPFQNVYHKRKTKICCFTYTKVHVSLFQDLPAALRRISNFLGRNLSEETIQRIAEHCSFKTMKSNNMSNFSLVPKVYMDADKSPFLRKGEGPCVHHAFS